MEDGGRITRRRVVAAAGSAAMAVAAPRRVRLSPGELKARVRGPVCTIPTPFTRDFAVDYRALRHIVRLGQSIGVGVYELTTGNSQYASLNRDEIKRLTRELVAAVAGRGVVIAATGPWWTGEAAEYARYAESVGADAVQVMVPDCADDAYVDHIRKVASATRLAIVLQGNPKPEVIRRCVAIPSVVCMKEDGTDEYYVEIQKLFGSRLAIFCGGQKKRYLKAQPDGSPAFFSFFDTFAPEVTQRFWSAVQSGNRAAESAIVDRYETPVFDFCLAGPRSFPAYWRGLMEHFGVASRTVRPPDTSCTDEDMRRIAELCQRVGLDPSRTRALLSR